MILIAMGVSGRRQNENVGEMLAERLHCAFTDGDAFRSRRKQGEDAPRHSAHRRRPVAVAQNYPRRDRRKAEGGRDGRVHVFVAEALVGRDILRDGDKDVCFVYLKGSGARCCKSV